jgi:hypothetical protein
MCKRVVCLAFVCMLGLAPVACADLIGWWQLDEGQGTVVTDSSGNGIDGDFVGTPQWAEGLNGGALELDGSSWVDFGDPPQTLFTGSMPVSIALWIYPTNLGTTLAASGHDRAFVSRNMDYAFKSSGPYARFTTPGVLDHNAQNTVLVVDEWQHVAVTFQPSTTGGCVFYLNGVETDRLNASAYNTAAATAGPSANGGPFLIGNNQWASNQMYFGRYDDIRLYDNILTAAEVKQLAARPKAYKPDPSDGDNAVALPLLQWTAGSDALLHNVYLGTTPDLTEANLVGSRQPFPMLYYTAGVEPGATYYWRVDEIAADGTVTTGDVWSFTAQALIAYNPEPVDGAGSVPPATTLTWLPGRSAFKHHLFLSDSQDAVAQGTADADQGMLETATFTPTDLQGGTTYFWRVDETLADGSIQTGAVWSFTTFILVDDFESYTDEEGSRIYESWIDGWTNGTGSTVGNVQAPFAEQTIVHSGLQSMPMDYNNAKTPFYSEAERTLEAAQDWTGGGLTDLSLWFRGRAASPEFTETSPGVYSIGACSNDVWGTEDSFRFYYKTLNGDGSITAKVIAVTDTTSNWAKAGVMIRESLDAGSTYGFMFPTPDRRRAFQDRPQTGGNAVSAHSATGVITFPVWVRVERKSSQVTGYYSTDGVTWTRQPDTENTGTDRSLNPQTIPMANNILVGLAVASNNFGAAACYGEFSDVSTTGNIVGQWQLADVGPKYSNDPAPLYVAVEDSAGKVAVATNDDPAAVNAADWTQWKIPLSDLTGADLTKVKTVYIGVGDRQNPAADGSGRIFIDDIRVAK